MPSPRGNTKTIPIISKKSIPIIANVVGELSFQKVSLEAEGRRHGKVKGELSNEDNLDMYRQFSGILKDVDEMEAGRRSTKGHKIKRRIQRKEKLHERIQKYISDSLSTS